jgi:hypothetical protein
VGCAARNDNVRWMPELLKHNRAWLSRNTFNVLRSTFNDAIS